LGFLLFLMCSHEVHVVFPLSSQWIPTRSPCFLCGFQHVFNSTSLCPICFAQSCPLGTYTIGSISGLICSYIYGMTKFILGSLQRLLISLWWANQRGLLPNLYIYIYHEDGKAIYIDSFSLW
jgi:hypothetical protein